MMIQKSAPKEFIGGIIVWFTENFAHLDVSDCDFENIENGLPTGIRSFVVTCNASQRVAVVTCLFDYLAFDDRHFDYSNPNFFDLLKTTVERYFFSVINAAITGVTDESQTSDMGE
jgi:hypothetical protein